MITTAIVFDHRNRKGSGSRPVEIRITEGRKVYYLNTGIKVLRSEFAGGTIVNHADSDNLNRRLVILSRKVTAAVNDCIEQGSLDIELVKQRVWSSSSSVQTVPDWIEQQIPDLGLKPGTMRNYRVLLSRLREYGQIIYWTDVTTTAILALDAWLHRLPSRPSDAEKKTGTVRRISDCAVHNYHKNFKALLGRAVLTGVLAENPYSKLKGKFKTGDKPGMDFLTEDEMQAIVSLQIKQRRVDVARDLAVMQMYTGMSYADLMAFDFDDYRQVNGKWMTTGERVKTSVQYVSQLLPPVIAVLEKYNYQVPHLSNTEYNRMLKVVGAMAGLSFGLHSHALRHTYATWVLRKNVPIQIAAKMMGHKSIAMTMRYAKILAQDVCSEYDRLEGCL